MRLPDLASKIKWPAWGNADLPKDIFVLLLILLVGFGAYILGRISTDEERRASELRLIETVDPAENTPEEGRGVPLAAPPEEPQVLPEEGTTTSIGVPRVGGAYVASKKGEVYYLPWCGGVKLIHEENKIWFATKEEAEARGYRPAANCKGM